MNNKLFNFFGFVTPKDKTDAGGKINTLSKGGYYEAQIL
jgi:hypothetical protein